MVVRHGHHGVELALTGAHEDRVRRERSAGVDALGARALDGRRDLLDLLATEQAPLAGVRVQAGHRDARRRHAHAAQRAIADLQGLQHVGAVDAFDGVAQRHVHGDQHHAQLGVGQHHAHRHTAGQLLQHLGVARIGAACGVQGFLVDRRGDQRPALSGLQGAHRRLDAQRSSRATARAHHALRLVDQTLRQAGRLPEGQRAGRRRLVGGIELHQRDAAGALLQRAAQHRHVAHHHAAGLLRGRLDQDLGPDAGGVTHRQQDAAH
jgi:hypothetical protein